VLVEELPLAQAVHQVDARISVVPSSIDLAAAEIELVSVLGRESLLRKRLEAARLDFDFILMDCPPSLGLLTINALAVAHEVIVPMQPHFLALQGVGKLLETVALVNRRMNPSLKVSGIVLTMFDAQTKLSAEVVKDLSGFIEAAKGKALPWAGARIFASKIRRNIKLAESPSFGQHVIEYEPTSNGAADYRALAREVAAMAPLARPVAQPAREMRVAATNAAPVNSPVPSGARGGNGSGAAATATAAVTPTAAASPNPVTTPVAAKKSSPPVEATNPPATASVSRTIDPASLAAAKTIPSTKPSPAPVAKPPLTNAAPLPVADSPH
jgi:chromosome partitioning protein